jgi:hypothetical protein
VIGRSDQEVLSELPPAAGLAELRPLAQAPASRAGNLPLAAHHRRRTSMGPGRGRRASIMVRQLRPLLQAVGAAGPDDLLAA